MSILKHNICIGMHTGFIAQGCTLKAQTLSANVSAQIPSSTSAEGGDSSRQK